LAAVSGTMSSPAYDFGTLLDAVLVPAMAKVQDNLRCSLAPTHLRAAPDQGRPSLRDLVLAWSLFGKSTSTSAHSHAGQSRRGNRASDCREIVIQRHRTRTRRPTLLVSRLSRIEPQGVGASMDPANTTCWEIQQCAA
jgi:hypothetical protein